MKMEEMDGTKKESQLTLEQQNKAEVTQVLNNLKWVWKLKKFPSQDVTRRFLEELRTLQNHVWLTARLLKSLFTVTVKKEDETKEDEATKKAIDSVLKSSGGANWNRNIIKNYINILSKAKCCPIELTKRLLAIHYEPNDSCKEEADSTTTALSKPKQERETVAELPDVIDSNETVMTTIETVSNAVHKKETMKTETAPIVTSPKDHNGQEVIVISSDEEEIDNECAMISTRDATPEARRKEYIERCIRLSRHSREDAIRRDLEAEYILAEQFVLTPLPVAVKPETFLANQSVFLQPGVSTSTIVNGQLALKSPEVVKSERALTVRGLPKQQRKRRRNKPKRKKKKRGTKRNVNISEMADIVVKKLKSEFECKPIYGHKLVPIRKQ